MLILYISLTGVGMALEKDDITTTSILVFPKQDEENLTFRQSAHILIY